LSIISSTAPSVAYSFSHIQPRLVGQSLTDAREHAQKMTWTKTVVKYTYAHRRVLSCTYSKRPSMRGWKQKKTYLPCAMN